MVVNTISILHISNDEKFINGAHWQFEKAFPGSNDFLICLGIKNRDFKYIETSANIKPMPYTKDMVIKITKLIEKYDCVFLHGLTTTNCAIFMASEVKSKFIGIFWGAEFYNRKDLNEQKLLGPNSELLEKRFLKKSLMDSVKYFIKAILFLTIRQNKADLINTANDLSYLGSSIEEEFIFLKQKKFIGEDCFRIPFTYYPLEFIIKGNDNIINDSNILIGNSASLSNNHIEAMNLLSKFNLDNQKIIIPLSYGNFNYANFVEKEGKIRFKENFIALRDFMPITDYNKILLGCGVVIMNHYRQQAFGNILACLWMGSKLYLSENNVLLSYFKRLGIVIFCIESDFNPENENALLILSPGEIETNRNILKGEIGEESLIRNLRSSIRENFLV